MVPWLVCGVLVVLVGVMILVWRRRSRQAGEALRATATAHEADRPGLVAGHGQELVRERAQREQDRAVLQEQIDVAERAAAATRKQLRKGMQWEEGSQQVIAAICREMGVHGALVTNVVFVPVETTKERKFVAQIDHLLLLESGALIIETKNWRGLVFDGLLPSAVHPSFTGLVDESALRAPFAIQIKNESIIPAEGAARFWWELYVHAGAASPCQQARTQARRMSDFTRQELGFTLWFGTCVFYTHPDAAVHANPEDRSDGGVTTAVVTNREQLRNVIRAGASKPPTVLTPTRLEALTELFGSRGAHLERFGKYTNRPQEHQTVAPQAP